MDTIFCPMAFLIGYYPFAIPNGSFDVYWRLILLLYIAISSLANLTAILFPTALHGLVSSSLVVVLWSFGGISPNRSVLFQRLGQFGLFMNNISPFRWSFELQMIGECKSYTPAYGRQVQYLMSHYDFTDETSGETKCVIYLLLYSFICNTLAVCWLLWEQDNFYYWRSIIWHMKQSISSFAAPRNLRFQ